MPKEPLETKTETGTKVSLGVKINLIIGIISALFIGAAIINALLSKK